MKKYTFALFFLFLSLKSFAVCNPGYSEIIVHIIPDTFQNEISWDILDQQGLPIASGNWIGDTICIDSNSCFTFRIKDSFGDGIFSPGGYWLYKNNALVATGYNYGFGESHTINCPAGIYCTSPDTITPGSYTTTYDDHWYIYTPATTGTYEISTCGLNTCNTKIWIYNTCPSLPYNEGVPGTYAFNDDNSCGTAAELTVNLFANVPYLIRIGDSQDSCSTNINFDFSYLGPLQGCTDSTACNFDPLAATDNGSCIYFPNPDCGGPDLEVDSAIFVNSLSLVTEVASACDVAEGCLLDYGTRYVITFTTRINNIGTLDFYIGNPSGQPGMFNLNNCHGHAHYEGYGDYRLYDTAGNVIPAGHKNGFCVIDLCGFGQYTCGNMGITAGCWDAYSSGTQCQWLDITDVPTGDYRVAVIINSKHLPDALGRFERNFLNNATQVCMRITQNPGGAPSFSLLPNCTPFVDCSGVPAGTSELDCNGICNGPGVYGDVFQNAVLNAQDVYTYLDILQSNFPSTNCYDLNRDSSLSIYDAALVNWCRKQGPLHPSGSVHNHCNFPRDIYNTSDSTGIAIKSVNYINNFIDVEVLNPTSKLKAFQFSISGITISNVVSLASPIDFPVDVRFIASTNEVIGISLEDSSLERSGIPQQLVRIYFSAITDTQICISKVTDMVNQNAERTFSYIFGNCFSTPTTGISNFSSDKGIVIVPNPARDKAYINFSNSEIVQSVFVTNIEGKIFPVEMTPIKNSWFELDLSKFPPGVYFVFPGKNKYAGAVRLIKL